MLLNRIDTWSWCRCWRHWSELLPRHSHSSARAIHQPVLSLSHIRVSNTTPLQMISFDDLALRSATRGDSHRPAFRGFDLWMPLWDGVAGARMDERPERPSNPLSTDLEERRWKVHGCEAHPASGPPLPSSGIGAGRVSSLDSVSASPSQLVIELSAELTALLELFAVAVWSAWLSASAMPSVPVRSTNRPAATAKRGSG